MGGKKGREHNWLSITSHTTEASPKSWMGRTSPAWGSPEKVPAQGRAQAFKAFKSNPLIPPKKNKLKTIICLRLRILSLFNRKSNSSSLPLEWDGLLGLWTPGVREGFYSVSAACNLSVMESPGPGFYSPIFHLQRESYSHTVTEFCELPYTVLQTLGNTGTTPRNVYS